MKHLTFLKRFRGISVSILKLQLNEWDGYGIIFLSIAIFNGGCINSRSLFFVNVYPEYSSGGKKKSESWLVYFSSIGKSGKRLLDPKKTDANNVMIYVKPRSFIMEIPHIVVLDAETFSSTIVVFEPKEKPDMFRLQSIDTIKRDVKIYKSN